MTGLIELPSRGCGRDVPPEHVAFTMVRHGARGAGTSLIPVTAGMGATGMDGFQGFRSEIDRVAAALGGGRNTRIAVAGVFMRTLDDIVKRRTGSVRYGAVDLPFDQVWTHAEDADFAEAVRVSTEMRLRVKEQDAVTATGQLPSGARMAVRGDVVSVEAGGYALTVAMMTDEDSKGGCSVFMTDSGKEYLWGSRFGGPSNKPTSVRLQKSTNAERSLRSLVEGFFRVKLVMVKSEPAVG